MKRVIKPEILDTLSPADARASLSDLVRLNRHFGGHSALIHALRAVVNSTEEFSMLDVGAASGDMGRVAKQRFPGAKVTSLDRHASHLELAASPKLAGDAFALPFSDRSFDLVFSSLFLHHFIDADVVRLLAEMKRVARRAVLAVDLHRHPIAYYFLSATRWLFGWHPVTVHDGAVSVAAAFKPQELEGLASRAGLSDPIAVARGLSFRITLVARIR